MRSKSYYKVNALIHQNHRKKLARKTFIFPLLKYIVLWALGPGAQLGYLYSTCTIHLYYTFVLHPCTTHICLLYKGTDVYSFIHRIEYNYSIFLTLPNEIPDPDAKKPNDRDDEEVLNKMQRNPRSRYQLFH